MIDKCPKCSGQMEKGISVVRTPRGGIGVLEWTTNIKTSWLGPADLENKKRVTSLVCNKCGYMESYVEKRK